MLLGWLLLLALLVACHTREAVAPARAPPAPSGPIAEVTARWDGAVLGIEETLGAEAGAKLAVERGAERFVKDAEASRDGAVWTPLVRRGREFVAPPCEGGACRVRYRYRLREAAVRFDDLDRASVESELVEAPPSTWILSPTRPEVRERTLRFHVDDPTFATGVTPQGPGTWDLTLDDLATAPYSAFGVARRRQVGSVLLAESPGKIAINDAQMDEWALRAQRAVSSYFGAFPLPNALLLVAIARGRWIGPGRTLAGGGGTTFVRIGEDAPRRAFEEDWVLVHEMIHLSFPSVPSDQDWAEEGIATYAEPIARARAGMLGEEAAWATLVEGLPYGLPQPGDRGLDHTHTWGRRYWGGALFWFLADLAIHEQTHDAKGVEHALRAVVAAGGTNAKRWPLERVMAVGDEATGTKVLTELYAAMRSSPHPVDLHAIFTSLGVGNARFDDAAPRAATRRAMTRGQP